MEWKQKNSNEIEKEIFFSNLLQKKRKKEKKKVAIKHETLKQLYGITSIFIDSLQI